MVTRRRKLNHMTSTKALHHIHERVSVTGYPCSESFILEGINQLRFFADSADHAGPVEISGSSLNIQCRSYSLWKDGSDAFSGRLPAKKV